MSKYKQVSEFELNGCFLGFAAKESYKLKYLRLSTDTGEYCIKIPKELRSTLYRTLQPGTAVHVSGYCEFCLKKGTTKFKAYQIYPATAEAPQSGTVVPFPKGAMEANPAINPASDKKAEKAPKKANILVCQKSDCCKRGGRALVEALQTEISDRGLSEQVAIKPTGCMKQCKAGPNLIMPDKTRYSRIRANEAASLIDKHFPTPTATGRGG
jgi:(2Fe-2S) ferredoxin